MADRHRRWAFLAILLLYLAGFVTGLLAPGERYALADFMQRTRDALGQASERVCAKYGFACSQAMDQLAQIELTAARFAATADPHVTVVAID